MPNFNIDGFWRKLAEKQNFTLWTASYFYGVFLEGALYDTSGLNQYLTNLFKDTKMMRSLYIGLANFLDGSYHIFDEETSDEDMLKVLLATISYPGVSKPIEYKDALWFCKYSLLSLSDLI